MRAWGATLAALCLLATACGDDEATSDPTPVSSTVAPATTLAPTPDSTSVPTPATTPAPTSDSAPSTASVTTQVAAPGSAAAPLIPEAVCFGNDGEIFFAYENTSGSPVVVPEGDANFLTAGMAFDNPLLTTLFAPGRVDPAFWAYPASTEELVWTLVGPDGVERQASGDSSLPLCAAGYPDDAVDDPRTPTLEIVAFELSPDRTLAEVFLELSGVPETSVCNPAFEPEPVLVSIGDGASLPTAYEPTTSVIVGPITESPMSGDRLARAYLYPLVVDQCSAVGVTVRTWSAADPLRGLTLVDQLATVCARLDEAGTLSVSLYETCDGLPATGGSSIRPQ